MTYKLPMWKCAWMVTTPAIAGAVALYLWSKRGLEPHVFAVLFVAFALYFTLTGPYEIEVREDDHIEVRSIARTHRFIAAEVTEILFIPKSRSRGACVALRCRDAAVRIGLDMPGVDAVIDAVRRDNPSVLVSGKVPADLLAAMGSGGVGPKAKS
jgi:hypothetical protein